MKYSVLSSPYLLLCIVLIFLQSCSSQKGTTEFAGMQNLTAKYNILYNSRILLDDIETNIRTVHYDDYSRPLSIYVEPTTHSAASQTNLLDSVIKKAKRIVEEKSASNYVDDAYLLIATAQYLKANFFEAAEYFSYIHRTYPHSRQLSQTALVMKARAEMQLGNITDAKNTLDTAAKYLQPDEQSVADIHATRAQMLISSGNEEEAVEELQKALDNKSAKKNKIRWRYVLAQLQLQKGELDQSYKNFRAVKSSNAPYEMAFNASVNILLIEDKLTGGNRNFISRLQSLLNDDKNADFTDQIFYLIAESYRNKEHLKAALDNYNKAIKVSTNNKSQKGLSYLRVADMYFDAAKYSTAKLYLDSALKTLPASFPEYGQIRKKSNNLDLLAARLQTIAGEDRLQALARLAESERSTNAAYPEQASNIDASASSPNRSEHPADPKVSREGKFYFNNATALSQGLSDFKKIWGNRYLEDHWRRSDKFLDGTNHLNEGVVNSSHDIDSNSSNTIKTNIVDNELPVTAKQLEQSNKRISDAMYDIGLFYRDELKDSKQAITTFESLLNRFPQSSNADLVNYNLYRLYQSFNPEKAEYYKNIILTRYPESNFAKVIIDPQFVHKANDKDTALKEIYDNVYNLYAQKKYDSVISRVKEVEDDFGNSELSPQFGYLNALSIGRTQRLPAFEDALKAIIKRYPEDQVVSPLVKQHLKYIDLNRSQFNSRLTALADHSETEEEFADDTQVQEKVAIELPPAIKVKHPDAPANSADQADAEPVLIESAKVAARESLFSLPDSAEYYFVVNVLNPIANLSSSRFGIGQFNRTNVQGEQIKHQLMHINNENQLILVGSFNDKASVIAYERRISPLLKGIMKIPVEKYNTFVITKDGLDKLKNSVLINSYLDFYKNSH